ncbi:MAG: UDP binding domain-containing protein, partial [Patescibacteria group bacterium]
ALSRLTAKHALPSGLLALILHESESRYRWLKEKVESLVFAKNATPRIAIWGLSYKKNTDSTHNAPSLKVIADFGKRAALTAYDPAVTLPPGMPVMAAKDRYAALAGADALLILSDWDVFKDPDITGITKAMKTPLVIDPLGVLCDRAKDLAHAGVSYVTMGKSELRE